MLPDVCVCVSGISDIRKEQIMQDNSMPLERYLEIRAVPSLERLEHFPLPAGRLLSVLRIQDGASHDPAKDLDDPVSPSSSLKGAPSVSRGDSTTCRTLTKWLSDG